MYERGEELFLLRLRGVAIKKTKKGIKAKKDSERVPDKNFFSWYKENIKQSFSKADRTRQLTYLLPTIIKNNL